MMTSTIASSIRVNPRHPVIRTPGRSSPPAVMSGYSDVLFRIPVKPKFPVEAPMILDPVAWWRNCIRGDCAPGHGRVPWTRQAPGDGAGQPTPAGREARGDCLEKSQELGGWRRYRGWVTPDSYGKS